MVILAEGAMDANKAMFVVDALGHPPAEPRDLALRTVGGEHMDVTCTSQRAAMGTDSCHF